ncbi:DUF1631 family protein [Permianibacter sp. IMCC34836]|uniref:DUF1631 family protein n=1 Tax=Permianibacter fluminis TaxID=2738515 RepID=UPI0015574BF7|nr:DUF1631 family protein [Permianibacter fluminis]NQD35564.1 DUF1631 family protein [Permianibacter fluminis]
MPIAASDALFDRLAALNREFPPANWRELLAAEVFAEPAALVRALHPAKTRSDAVLLLAAALAVQVGDSDELDATYLQAMRPFWFTVATASLTDWQFWHSPRQPLRRLLHQLLLTGRSYSLSAHPASAQFPQRLHSRLNNLAEQAIAGAGPDNLLPLLKSLYALLRNVHDQQRHSDHRLLEQEDQSRRTLHAQADTSRAIRQAVWGQPVPASVVNFLDETWRKYLQLLHLKVGMQHPLWQQAIADIQAMVRFASEASPDELGKAVKTELPGLMRRIREAVAQTRTSEQGQRFPETFAALLAARARNLPDAGLPLGELLDEPDDVAAASSAASNRGAVPDRGESLLLKRGNDWLRVRVANHLDEGNYVLLADFAGSRVAAFSPNELHALMQEDKARVLPDRDPVQALLPQLPHLLKALLSSASDTQARQREQAEQQQQAAAEQAMRQREAVRAAEFAKRQQAEAAERAERIAEERRQAEQAALLATQQEKARALIATLRSGALVELRRDQEHFRACYLAMIRASDQHYLFVDRQGQKVAEHDIDALIQLVLVDGFRVVESGSALDNTLQNLVSERRQFLSDEDGS